MNGQVRRSQLIRAALDEGSRDAFLRSSFEGRSWTTDAPAEALLEIEGLGLVARRRDRSAITIAGHVVRAWALRTERPEAPTDQS